MKVTTKREVTITLQLTEDEASWLRGICQNTISDSESKRDSEMRSRFWYALDPRKADAYEVTMQQEMS